MNFKRQFSLTNTIALIIVVMGIIFIPLLAGVIGIPHLCLTQYCQDSIGNYSSNPLLTWFLGFMITGFIIALIALILLIGHLFYDFIFPEVKK